MYITFHFQSVTKCQILIVRKHVRRASTVFMVMNTTVSQIVIGGNPAIRKKKIPLRYEKSSRAVKAAGA